MAAQPKLVIVRVLICARWTSVLCVNSQIYYIYLAIQIYYEDEDNSIGGIGGDQWRQSKMMTILYIVCPAKISNVECEMSTCFYLGRWSCSSSNMCDRCFSCPIDSNFPFRCSTLIFDWLILDYLARLLWTGTVYMPCFWPLKRAISMMLLSFHIAKWTRSLPRTASIIGPSIWLRQREKWGSKSSSTGLLGTAEALKEKNSITVPKHLGWREDLSVLRLGFSEH